MTKTLLLKVFIGTLVTYGLIGFYGVPYWIKNIAPSYIEESTDGGEYGVGSVYFNPFTFYLKLEDLSFKSPDSTPLLNLKQFVVDFNPLDYLWNGGWVIHEFTLDTPQVNIVHTTQGEFNFGWLSRAKGDDNETERASELPNVIIQNLTLKEGVIDYADFADGKNYHHKIDPIGFHLENIRFREVSRSKGGMKLYATINDGGHIDLRGKIKGLDPYKIEGSVELDSGKLSAPWRYVEEKLPIQLIDGNVVSRFKYRVDTSDLNATEVSDFNLKASKLRLIDKLSKKDLFALDSLDMRGGRIFPLQKRLQLGVIDVDGIRLEASRSVQGKIDWINYMDQIDAAFPEDDNETKEPWRYMIDRIDINRTALVWEDKAPIDPYTVALSNLFIHATGVSSDERHPLIGLLRLEGCDLIRHRDQMKVASVGALSLEGIGWDRKENALGIETVKVENPAFRLSRLKNGTLDISRMIPVKREVGATTEQKALRYRIEAIHLLDGLVQIKDNLPSKTVSIELDAINAQMKGLESDLSTSSSIEINTRINQKAHMELTGDVTRSPLHSSGRLKLKGFDLSLVDPYVEPHSYAALRRGTAGVNLRYRYEGGKIALEGTIGLNDWVLNDRRDNSVLLGWESIGVTPFRYAYPDNRVKINQLNVNGLYANALIDSNKTLNFSKLSREAQMPLENTNKVASSNPFGLDIIKLTVRNSSATFTDQSLPLPFKTYIRDLEGSVLGISTTKDTTTFVKLKGGVDRYGLANIKGSLNTNAPKSFTDMNVRFDNLELKQYTPYSLQFLGYEIDQGKLFLDLGYKIDKGQLLGKNHVTIKQIELGKEQASGSPWPMRFVVALLEDADGVIDIDMPVEGDVNNPDFKYGKVVWQVIGNLFTKAVSAPFRFLSSMMGIESDILSSIDFEPGSASILPPEQEKLDKVAEILTKRPKLTLQVFSGINKEGDERALRIQKLIEKAVSYDQHGGSSNEGALTLSVLEKIAKETLGRSRVNEIKEPIRERERDETLFVRHYTQALIDTLIPLQVIEPGALEALVAKRSSAIVAALKSVPKSENRIKIGTAEGVKTSKSGDVPSRLEISVP